IELNGSFYSLQRPSSYERWRDETPPSFVFSVKGGRFITHMLSLRGARTALANYFASGVLALGDKLGPVLWQLPERLHFDAELLEEFFGLLPRTTAEAVRLTEHHDDRVDGRMWTEIDADRPIRHALEVRHPSFVTQEAVDLIRRNDVSLVVADTAGRWPLVREVTSDFVYVRLHGAEELYSSGYTDEALDSWAREIRGWLDGSGCPDGRGRDVYVYFDNDTKVHAPFDAMHLAERLA
ncbi:MAG TPA: DUF72 domain-containing protein, partial [Lacisediminihabitans sp.]|uniref:DUF72 domain-containing protein n=1 Tax=Lacisediminihabitans sp. TaxID=2787631 RepID=UPI002EDA255E